MESRGSVTPNKERIEGLRKTKAWSVEHLSLKAGIAMRTAQNAVAGIPVRMDTLKRIADALEVEYKELLLGSSGPQRMKVQVIIQLDLSRADAPEVALFINLLGNSLPATHEIVIKDIRDGSVIITLSMSHDDVVRLVEVFPDLSERAREIIRETPDGMAYFRGEQTEGAERVRRLLEMVDAAREVRILLEEPPALVEEPPTTSEDWEPYYDRFRGQIMELGKLIRETQNESVGDERERKLAAMQKALEKLWQDLDGEVRHASSE